ncbi:response regulator transcription factor [Streptomyces albogriseolus]
MTVAPQIAGPSTTIGGPAPSLTEIERTVLHHIAMGLTHKEIAEATAYTFDGISKIRTRILRKLGARSQSNAVYLAVQAGILDAGRRHGDHAGFAAHRYRGEEPCEACWEGERAYRRERRAARKERQVNAA